MLKTDKLRDQNAQNSFGAMSTSRANVPVTDCNMPQTAPNLFYIDMQISAEDHNGNQVSLDYAESKGYVL